MDVPGAPGVVIKDVWELQEQIGKGSFAVVWKAQHRSDGRLAAVKEISTEKLNSKLQESLESEVAVLLRAKHQNIVKLYDVLSVSLPARRASIVKLSDSLGRSSGSSQRLRRHPVRLRAEKEGTRASLSRRYGALGLGCRERAIYRRKI